MPTKKAKQEPIYLPPQLNIDVELDGNRVVQLARPGAFVEKYDVRVVKRDGFKGQLIEGAEIRSLVVARGTPPPDIAHEAVATPRGILLHSAEDYERVRSRVSWLIPAAPPLPANPDEWETLCGRVRHSWRGQFSFAEEEVDSAGRLVASGLRPPQIGGIYAALAHWKASSEPATIVMPTGTGKTETMLALLANQRFQRLLVVVPTSALRTQTVAKFQTFGLLKTLGVLGPNAQYPVVGTIETVSPSVAAVTELFQRCNVLVATMAALTACGDFVKQRIAELTSHLFIDEAHHVPAPRWDEFRSYFKGKRVIQFTATPFRRDSKRIDGAIVFNYPMRLAQAEGYFKPITLVPVREYDRDLHHERIAEAALKQLRDDARSGYRHLVMARTETIERATEVHAVYLRLAPELRPVLVHSKKGQKATRDALTALRAGTSSVVVCVDMLGEGFDLPQLKIAALHDVHKSLAITLQFTGRFTRATPKVGDASVIANVADAQVEDTLEALYAEDADWNLILRRLSEGATGRELRRSELLDGFADPPTQIRLENLLPKMTTLVYRTKAKQWRPKAVSTVLPADVLFAGPTVNHKARVAMFVTKSANPVPWGRYKHLLDTIYDLHLVHWSESRGLFFVNSTDKDSSFDALTKAVMGDGAGLIRGEQVFRVLDGVRHTLLMNIGLRHSLSRAVRFTMYVGADIREALSEASLRTKTKSNLFGRGYEGGERTSVGASAKGRIWSHRVAEDLSEWLAWCDHIGRKLLDESISVDKILKHVILPKQIKARPALVPLTIEWSDYFLDADEDSVFIQTDGLNTPLVDVGLELTAHEDVGPLRFRLFTPSKSVEYEVVFSNDTVQYRPMTTDAVIVIGRRSKPLSEWFDEEPPIIRFENGAFLIHDDFAELPGDAIPPFSPAKIETLDWAGVNLRKESQGSERSEDSIQRRVIRHITDASYVPQYDIVFDDDDTNESADIVGVKLDGEALRIDLFHCKYAKTGKPTARVDDLYAVCGQVQRSVPWKGRHERLLKHLQNREASRLKRGGSTRFDRGNAKLLSELTKRARRLRPEMTITLVQPGLSRVAAQSSHLQLLAATELYLRETYAVAFRVLASL